MYWVPLFGVPGVHDGVMVVPTAFVIPSSSRYPTHMPFANPVPICWSVISVMVCPPYVTVFTLTSVPESSETIATMRRRFEPDEIVFVFPVDHASRRETSVARLSITMLSPETTAFVDAVVEENCAPVVSNHSGTVMSLPTVMLLSSEYCPQVFVLRGSRARTRHQYVVPTESGSWMRYVVVAPVGKVDDAQPASRG